jgi:hypothetical protein
MGLGRRSSPHIADDAVFRVLDRVTLAVLDLLQRTPLRVDVTDDYGSACPTMLADEKSSAKRKSLSH